MPSALSWKYIGKSVLGGSATIADALDAIYTLFNASSYDDSSSRTAGAGVAWNPTKVVSGVTIGVHLTASSAASSTAQGCKICFAGKATEISDFPLLNFAANRFPMATGDHTGGNHTWSNSFLYGGLAKNAGNFNSLSPGVDTTPFTSGGWTGFSKIADDAHWANGTIYAYESLDCIWISVQDGSHASGMQQQFSAGGIIDPNSTDSADGEADNVRYGMLSSANVNINATGPYSVSDFPCFGAGDNDHVGIVYSVGATTYTLMGIVLTQVKTNTGSGGQNSGKLASGKYYGDVMSFNEYHDVGGDRRIIGKWREVLSCQTRHTASQEIQSGGAAVAYLIGQTTGGLGTGFMLKV